MALRHPLAPVAGLFLLGVAGGWWLHPAAGVVVIGAAVAWSAWVVAEFLRVSRGAGALLGTAIVLCGAGVWVLNQESVERGNLVRFAPGDAEMPVTFRGTVLVADAGESDSHAAEMLVARADEVLTDRGWQPAAGDVVVASRSAAALEAGDRAEFVGWLSRVAGPMNPGAMDRRAMLGAERIFAQVRVPRETGVTRLSRDDTGTAGKLSQALAQGRDWLRGKLLQNIALGDAPAAYTLSALLLGVRDPVINSVSQAFFNAGAAHLLAISGSHVVLFTLLVWSVMRFVPLRPRGRDVIIALIVGAYILATPCGPPIMRAAIALVLVLWARLSGKPAQHVNTLAAAALLVVLLRPADMLMAGFQLSFAATLGLILLAPRVYEGLFGRWIERETLVVELSQSRWARRRLTAQKWLCGLLVANMLGASAVAPLVAFHFGQINLWAVVAGVVALPFVMLAITAGVLQLLATLISTALGAWIAPLTTLAGAVLIRAVNALAALPGASVAVRAPPVWVVVVVYAAVLAWALRQRVGLSRAMALNGCVAALALAAGWYAWTMPVAQLQFTVLDAGQASSVLIRTPTGAMWALNAGAERTGSAETLFRPALRVAGEARLGGLIVQALDVNHAAGAADLVDWARPGAVFVAAPAWARRQETLAGAGVEGAVRAERIPVQPLRAGQILELGGGARMEILWPPEAEAAAGSRTDLIVLCSFASSQVLIADPAALPALVRVVRGRPGLRADAIIFTGAPKGAADEPLRELIAPLEAKAIVWTGRSLRSESQRQDREWNTADGAVELEMDKSGVRLRQSGPLDHR